MKRQATYEVIVPIKFTYVADNDLELYELHKDALREFYKRLDNGYFDVLEKDAEVVNKITHYTKEELEKRESWWKELIGGK